jgi:hypothetical protein
MDASTQQPSHLVPSRQDLLGWLNSSFYEQIYDLNGDEADQDIEKRVLTNAMKLLGGEEKTQKKSLDKNAPSGIRVTVIV